MARLHPRGGPSQRRQVVHAYQPGRELWSAVGQVTEAAGPGEVERHRENQMRHGRWPLRQWRGHLALKQVRHALAAGGLVAESGRGTFALGSPHLTHPNRDSIAQAARSGLEPAMGPIRIRCRAMQAGLAVEAVKISADELAVLHADAG